MQLARAFRLQDLILLIIGAVIGSGIFLVPAVVLRQVGGRPWMAFLAWLLGGVLSLLGALTYGELSARVPKAGGLYIYIRDCFGRLPAFLYGWALFFVISSGAVATLAVAFSVYLSQLIPLSSFESKLVSILMITCIGAVNVLGTRKSATLQNWTTVLKLAALVVMSLLLLFLGEHQPQAGSGPNAPALGTNPLVGLGLAMISVLWAYEGWQYATFSAGETIDPQKNFPRAFLVGLAAVTGAYLLANAGYIVSLGVQGVMGSDNVAAAALTAVAGASSKKLLTIAILISIFSAANAFTLTSTRVYYAMALDGVFFKKLAEVHPHWGTPAFAVIAGCVCAAILALSGTFEQLLTYVVFSGWIFYALGAGALFVYRRRFSEAPPEYEVPGYPWTPALFILSAGLLVVNVIVGQPAHAAVGLGIVLLGAPAYFLWISRRGGSTFNSAAALQDQETNSKNVRIPDDL